MCSVLRGLVEDVTIGVGRGTVSVGRHVGAGVANATRDASVAPAPVHTRYRVPGGDRLVPVLKVATRMPLVPHVLLERKDW